MNYSSEFISEEAVSWLQSHGMRLTFGIRHRIAFTFLGWLLVICCSVMYVTSIVCVLQINSNLFFSVICDIFVLWQRYQAILSGFS